MIESFIHSDYQIPEITRKLTLEQRMEQRVADLIQDGTEKILDAVQRLADTKADKSPGSTPADMASAKWDPNDV